MRNGKEKKEKGNIDYFLGMMIRLYFFIELKIYIFLDEFRYSYLIINITVK